MRVFETKCAVDDYVLIWTAICVIEEQIGSGRWNSIP